MTAVPQPVSRKELAELVRELGDRVLLDDMPDDQVDEAHRALTTLLSPLRSGASVRSPQPYGARSPFIGVENATSPLLQLSFDDVVAVSTEAVSESTVRGHVVLSDAHAGPPGCVHGGVLAGLFDEVCGAVAGAVSRGSIVVTGRLTVRYRMPTPTNVSLEFTATTQQVGRRTVVVDAVCAANGTRTADANALMVVRDR